MAPAADDDNDYPTPWRADPGRSETRWDPGDTYSSPGAPWGRPYGQPAPASPGRPRWWLLVALGLALVVVVVVVRYLV